MEIAGAEDKKTQTYFYSVSLIFFHWISEGRIQQSEVNPVNEARHCCSLLLSSKEESSGKLNHR